MSYGGRINSASCNNVPRNGGKNNPMVQRGGRDINFKDLKKFFVRGLFKKKKKKKKFGGLVVILSILFQY